VRRDLVSRVEMCL